MISQTNTSSARAVVIGMVPTRYKVILPFLSQLYPSKASSGIIESSQYDATTHELRLVPLANGSKVIIENISEENLEILMAFVKQLLHYDAITTYRYADAVLTLTGRSEGESVEE